MTTEATYPRLGEYDGQGFYTAAFCCDPLPGIWLQAALPNLHVGGSELLTVRNPAICLPSFFLMLWVLYSGSICWDSQSRQGGNQQCWDSIWTFERCCPKLAQEAGSLSDSMGLGGVRRIFRRLQVLLFCKVRIQEILWSRVSVVQAKRSHQEHF